MVHEDGTVRAHAAAMRVRIPPDQGTIVSRDGRGPLATPTSRLALQWRVMGDE